VSKIKRCTFFICFDFFACLKCVLSCFIYFLLFFLFLFILSLVFVRLRSTSVRSNRIRIAEFESESQGYKSLLRRELQAEFDRRQLSDQFFDQNRDKIFSEKKLVAELSPVVEPNRVSIELTEAVPPTETLNVEAQRSRAELGRQGSLADRNPPASLAQVRAKQAPAHLSFEPDVTYDDGAPVLDGFDPNDPVSQIKFFSVTDCFFAVGFWTG
jgi:hypothetical protein